MLCQHIYFILVAKTAHTWEILPNRADQVFQSCEKMSSSSTAACEKYASQIRKVAVNNQETGEELCQAHIKLR